jgi:hypothetical protein
MSAVETAPPTLSDDTILTFVISSKWEYHTHGTPTMKPTLTLGDASLGTQHKSWADGVIENSMKAYREMRHQQWGGPVVNPNWSAKSDEEVLLDLKGITEGLIQSSAGGPDHTVVLIETDVGVNGVLKQ